MGIFKFLKRKSDASETPVPAVEPLPLQFEIADFSVGKIDSPTEEATLKPEIVAAITAAVQAVLNEKSVNAARQPLVRRQAGSAWKTAGLQQVMQARQ